METALIVLGVVLWLASVVFLGKLCALTDDHPRPLLKSPPRHVRLVRDEKDAAA